MTRGHITVKHIVTGVQVLTSNYVIPPLIADLNMTETSHENVSFYTYLKWEGMSWTLMKTFDFSCMVEIEVDNVYN